VKDILPKILLFLNIVFITLTLYFSSWVFYYQYEPEYYENYYYHSQWNIPNSVRGIGDGDLYKIVGYQLANGENPFNINYEVPPLVKLLYGITEKYTGNPYIVSILFYFLSIYVLYKFSEIIFNKNKTLTLSCILLFVTSPFIATQLKETMLDLPLTFFFLSHLYFFYKYYQTKNIKDILFSGFCLGLATGTKIGVYTPILGLISFLILLFTKNKKKKILVLFTYTASVFSGYILSYISYFLKHPNPIPWVRLHQKTISFYLGTQNSHYIDKLNQLKGIFLNQYQGFWLNASRTTLGDWSPLIPIGTVLILVAIYFSLKNKNKSLLYMALFSITILFINSIIPFYPRYLMPLIPVFCIFIVYFFQKKYSFLIFVIALLNIPFFFKSLAINKNTGTLETTIFFLNTRNYRQLYRALPQNQRIEIPEQYFIDNIENFFNQIGTYQINYQLNGNNYTAQIVTRYGNIEHQGQFKLKEINHQWKLIWYWDYLYPKYQPNYKIVVHEDTKTPLIREAYVIPRTFINWGEALSQIQEITKINQKSINERIRYSIPDKYPRWIGNLSTETKINPNYSPYGLTILTHHNKAKIFFNNSLGQTIYLLK